MDRRTRRYCPTSEGLEGRQLLSTVTGVNPKATAVTSTGSVSTISAVSGSTTAGIQIDGQPPVADTIEAKLQHIQNYPYFIGQLNRDGAVPQPEVAVIQSNLRALIGTMHVGDSTAVHQFNLDLRNAETSYNILPDQAAALNRDFGNVLLAGGADAQITANLQAEMNQLTQAATQQSDPALVARNEYATTLELALGTGRPLLAPAKPRLSSPLRKGTINNLDVTNVTQPTLTGTYVANVNIQIVDANNTVFGTATTNSNGAYSVKFTNPLPNGTYTVRVRAEDLGYFSPPSKTYTFVVNAKNPTVKHG